MATSPATGIAVLSQGRAAVYEEPLGPAGVRIRERRKTRPVDGAVAVNIRASSINHLDLWMAHGAQREVTPPRVIAADGAGVVAESGDPRWKSGDEVVIYPVRCCWECEWCRAGENVKCPQFGVIGEHTDGTACELFHIDAHNIFPKPRALDWNEAAAFPLTFLTAWRMLTTRARLKRDETVLVVGAGAGVAVAAIAIARHLGARVFATSRSDVKRKRALELGAEAVFDSSDFSKAVRAASGGGVDVVFEHVGPATLTESMRSVVMGGRIVTCGSTSGVRAEIAIPRLFFGQMDLLGSTMGNASEFRAVLDAIDAGMRPVVDTVYPLAEVEAALTRLDAAEQFGKVVLSVSE
ncbi:MAG TPA: zinc-binding dehydrogenase [Candidatus Dormibacteraeota bacterium]|nr:zinc-binding dehydrogenase [Candidatus Dormibacteraeota bacterium]